MIAEVNGVYACIQTKRVDVGKQGIEKIIPETYVLYLVESKAIDQVLLGFVENADIH